MKKKAFRIKLVDLCKTIAKKSSPDMINFYVVLSGHDTARLPCTGENSKFHHYKQKVQKLKDLPISWVLTGKQFEDF